MEGASQELHPTLPGIVRAGHSKRRIAFGSGSRYQSFARLCSKLAPAAPIKSIYCTVAARSTHTDCLHEACMLGDRLRNSDLKRAMICHDVLCSIMFSHRNAPSGA